MNEFYDIEISALLDNELDHDEVLALVDHLVESEQSRPFYRSARSLGRVIACTDLPEDLWKRIEGRVEKVSGRRFPRWPLKLVAIAVCAIGIWSVARYLPKDIRVSDPVVSVQLASDSGRMTEDRFIELTTELLQADRRYHSKMGEIMNAVNASAAHEGSAEGQKPLTDDQDFLLALNRELDERQEPLWD